MPEAERLRPARRGNVDDAGATGQRGSPADDKPIGRQADEREKEIEARKVASDKDAEAAGQCRQPPDRESAVLSALAPVSSGIDRRRNPEKRCAAEQHRARPIERECQSIGSGRQPNARADSSASHPSRLEKDKVPLRNCLADCSALLRSASLGFLGMANLIWFCVKKSSGRLRGAPGPRFVHSAMPYKFRATQFFGFALLLPHTTALFGVFVRSAARNAHSLFSERSKTRAPIFSWS